MPPLVILLWLIVPIGSTNAAELKEATVTQIVKEVQLLPAQAAPRPAVVKDQVRGNTAVRTGTDSRTELTFTNQTLTRLGANTIFSFNAGTHNLNLSGGVMLLYVPKGSGGATISSAAVSAAITGTTVMMEYHPNAYIKFISLEGIARVYLRHRLGESVLIHPGQMLIVNPNAKNLPDPVRVDLKRILKTSLLITGFRPLPSEALMYQEAQIQAVAKANGQFVDTNLIIFGGGTLVSLVDPTNVNIVSQNTVANPVATTPPVPSKFGTPSVITSPNPYLLTSGTVITTDPTITTNGVTDFGKVWRGAATDGPFSAFVFGSTSAFDSAHLDTGVEKIADSGAVFKFTSLELTGNPLVSTTNGEIDLALVGVNGITSGGPGGTLTFAGISALLLATQDGSINLGPEISFSGFHDLVFYARGAGSNLTLASPISATIKLRLFAEGSLQVSSVNASLNAERVRLFASDSITLNGGVMSATAANSSGNVDIFAGNNISITLGLEIDRKFGGQPSGLNVSLTADANLTAGNSLVVKVDNSMGNLADGANITLDIGNNLTINGGGDLNLIIGNDDGGQIGNGGNISVMAGGSLFTHGLSLLVTNFGDVFGHPGTSVGHIGAGGNIFVTTGGNLTTDFTNAFIDNRNGASIDSGATISFDIGGALTTQHNAPPSTVFPTPESLTLLISNRFDTTTGGTIGSDATISLTASSVSVGGKMSSTISNRSAPAIIGGSALINFDVAGNLHADDYASFAIANEDVFNLGHGGTIKSDALIDVSAANISTGQDLVFFINNKGTVGAGGMIGGDATINVTAGNIVPTGPLDAEINNQAGNIGGNASISLTASGLLNLPANSIVRINNRTGGKVGKSTAINLTSTKATGVAINIASSAQLLALLDAAAPGPGGKITILATGVSSSINVNGGPGGLIEADKGTVDIRHTGGSGTINVNNADVAADIVKIGALGTNGTLNIGGGTLSADTTLKLYAPSSNGTVNFIANVVLSGNGLTTIAGNTVTIFNGVVVTVNQPNPASVFTNHPNYAGFGGNDTTTGTFAGAGATTQPLKNAPPFDP